LNSHLEFALEAEPRKRHQVRQPELKIDSNNEKQEMLEEQDAEEEKGNIQEVAIIIEDSKRDRRALISSNKKSTKYKVQEEEEVRDAKFGISFPTPQSQRYKLDRVRRVKNIQKRGRPWGDMKVTPHCRQKGAANT